MRTFTDRCAIPGRHRIRRLPFLEGLLALFCGTWLLEGGTLAGAVESQILHSHVPALVARLPALESLASTNNLNLLIALPLRNQPVLTGFLEQLYDPSSQHYHQYLKPAEFVEQFGPTSQDYEAVIAFAKANGPRVSGTHPNRTLLNVSGAAADIEKTFHVQLRIYPHLTEEPVLRARC